MNGELVTGSLMEIEGVSLFFDYCSRTAKRKTNHGFSNVYVYIGEILVLRISNLVYNSG